MFGDLLGDMESKQKEMAEKLSQIEVSAEAGDGAVTVKANANKEILNIKIDASKVSLEDIEELEDLTLIAINRALAKAGEEQEKETQNIMNDILPSGLGGLFGQ